MKFRAGQRFQLHVSFILDSASFFEAALEKRNQVEL